MANAAKRKGSNWELAVERFLAGHGVLAQRIPAGASDDLGDIWSPFWTLECKAVNAMSLGAWMDETVTEQHNRKTPWHALIVKRRGKAAARDGFVVMSMDQLASIMRALGTAGS